PIPDNGVVTYFKGVTLLPEPGTVDGYYKFNNYIDTLTKIYLYTQLDIPVPFTDRSNGTAQKECTPILLTIGGQVVKEVSVFIFHILLLGK
ncbi:long polar fimbrial protein LpfD, partial [Escherichia coli]|nr:long polar fimbrial protein LpfD [Escherichia coli]